MFWICCRMPSNAVERRDSDASGTVCCRGCWTRRPGGSDPVRRSGPALHAGPDAPTACSRWLPGRWIPPGFLPLAPSNWIPVASSCGIRNPPGIHPVTEVKALFYWLKPCACGSGGFRLDSPVKSPDVGRLSRCAPPNTDRVGEEPDEGGYPSVSATCGSERFGKVR